MGRNGRRRVKSYGRSPSPGSPSEEARFEQVSYRTPYRKVSGESRKISKLPIRFSIEDADNVEGTHF